MNNTTLLTSLGLLTAALLAPPPSAQAQRGAVRAATLTGFDWRVPIHTLPADPTFGAYGVWAAGRGYKVSFHDGMCFYPVLGAQAPQNLPLRWETAGIRMGSVELLDPDSSPRQHHDSWRFEYRSVGVSEIYDVCAEGVEQSFVIDRPAHIDGDLEVTGRWSSPLRPIRDFTAGSAKAAIRFVDRADREILRYGAAIAFDAAGQRVDVATELDGDSIRLTVPASWVRRARWPITIDPLLSPQSLASAGSMIAAIDHSDVHITRSGAARRVMTTFSLPSSATDNDTYAVLSDENLQNSVMVFADVGASVDTNHPHVAFVSQAGTTGRWTIAMGRRTTLGFPLPSQIRVWLHDSDNTTFQSGSMMTLPLTTPGWSDRKPDIGGSQNDQYTLLVYESNNPVNGTANDPTEVHRVLIDADTRIFGTPALIDTIPISAISQQNDRANPTVSQISDGAPLAWMVCYQQRAFIPTHYYLKGRRISPSSPASPPAMIVDLGQTTNTIEPSVDGANTRYGVTYVCTDNSAPTTGTKIGMTRFMWPPTANAPTHNWGVALETAGRSETVDEPRVVADVNVGNWAVAYRKRSTIPGRPDRIAAARVGFNGAVVETQTVYSTLSTDGAAPSITFDFPNKRFIVAYGTRQASSPVFGRIWTYPSTALNVPYGTTCGGTFGAITTPLVGTEFFRIRLNGAMPNTPAVLFVGGQATNLDLGVINMPGCSLLTNPIVSLPATTDASGNALLTIVHLEYATDLYLQWAHVSVGSNPLGLLTTNGVRSQIR